MVLNHPTLGRAAIRQAAAWTLAVVSSEARIEVPMPFIVADSIASFLGCSILHRPCILRRSVSKQNISKNRVP